MPVIIKRYPNRKLYDTERKKYITLEGIAGLIRQGEEVQVLDHTTGEDLTTLTLSQIIFEQEKRRGGFLPKTVLTGLIQAGGDTLSDLRRALAHPLDLLHQVDEEIKQRIQDLIEADELQEDEGERLLDKLLAQTQRVSEVEQIGERYLTKLLAKRGVPTRDELQKLNRQIDALAADLEAILRDRENRLRL
jgi:polyhydroxyalkanoate synthesis repressor PhaR